MLFGLSGLAICGLAVADFWTSSGGALKRQLILTGLLMWGMGYCGLAVTAYLRKDWPQAAAWPQTSLLRWVSGGAVFLAVAVAVLGFTLHGLAIALALVTLLLAALVSKVDPRR